MVSTLQRKLWRDVLQMKGQAVTIGLVVCVGVAVLVATMTTYQTLAWAQNYFYQHYRFADVFASLKRAPLSLAAQIREIPGVVTVETRVAKEANLDIENMDEPAVGYFTSLPQHQQAELNRLDLVRGHWLDPKRDDEILVGDAFAKAHHLNPGGKITAIINGRRQQFTIAGIVLSPEHVFAIRSQTLLPDNRHYGVFWLSKNASEAAFGMVSAFNNVVLKLSPTANRDEVITQLDRLLLPYGGLGAQQRDEQLSNRFLRNEFVQLHFLATVVPAIFIAVAAFLLNMVIARLIVLQRHQIAILKALGYTDLIVGLYYITLVVGIVIAGSICGTLLGILLGKGLLHMYTEFFVFPLFSFQFRLIYPLIGASVSLAAALVGAIGAVYSVIKLPPSEAMRPPVPLSYRHNWWDRSRLFKILSPETKMLVRNLMRRPLRNSFTAVCIGFGVAIIMLALFWQDSFNRIIDTQFMLAEREHVLVSFIEPAPAQSLHSLAELPGVLHIEGYRIVPIRLRHENRSYLTGIIGYPENMRQRLLLDDHLQKIQILPGTLLISHTLADILAAKIGDSLEIDVLEGKRGKYLLPLARVVDDYVGLAAYMDLDSLNTLLGDYRLISDATILYDVYQEKALYKHLKETPRVATITIKRTLIHTFTETFAQNMLIFTSFLAGFAMVIAIGIVYNSARIALSERAWELASLRVLGFTRREVLKIILGELAIVQILGILIGFIAGYLLANLSVTLVPIELVRLPLIITSQTYAIAALATLLAGVMSAIIVSNRIKHLDLIAVLKTMD